MNRLGDAPTDVLFGLIALNNNLVAPAVIPAALRAQVLEPSRTLAELLVTQGALTPVAARPGRDDFRRIHRARQGGDALKGPGHSDREPVGPRAARSARRPRDDREPHGRRFARNDRSARARSATRRSRPYLAAAGKRSCSTHGRGSPVTRSWRCWARVGWGSSTRRGSERLDRFVALKMIRAGAGARPEDLARFETEAKAVAAIEHTNIVKIFEIGEQDGLPYFSLEYLPGGSLAKKIGGKPQPVDEAARIVEILARAIHVAHEHKVIHRDLKPANVLFAADGTLKITDFGLVKRLEGDSRQTRSGSILGTPSYMAPEQARGESQTVGPAADQYALGAILYELLTGRPPFQGTSVLDTLDMVRSKEPVPPSQLQPKTPRDLETICLKCLEKDIARRYPDVLALAEDLRRLQAGETILARPVSAAERLWRWCLRNRRVASLSAAVVLLLLIVAVGSAIAAVTLGKANAVAEDGKEASGGRKAVAAARAANEQNRNARGSRGRADYPAHAYATGRARDPECARADARQGDRATRGRGQGDDRPAPRRGLGPQGRGEQLAVAGQGLPGTGHCEPVAQPVRRSQWSNYQQAEEIIARLAAADPDDLDMQVNLLKTQRELGNVSMYRLGDTEGAQRYFRKADRD